MLETSSSSATGTLASANEPSVKNQSGWFEPEPTKLPTIQGLRAIAALAVGWCHLAYGIPEFSGTFLAATGAPGYLGVYVFFVISGFIVPHAMLRAGYQLRNFFSFMAKRMVRVEPPYLFSIVLSVALWYASSRSSLYQGRAISITWQDLALHIGYLVPFFRHHKWISGVYWSLAVEFQYYIALSLMFPLLASRRQPVRIAACLAFACMCALNRRHHMLPEVAPVFVIGIVTMLYMAGIVKVKELIVMTTALSCLTVMSLWPSALVTALATMACILAAPRLPKFLLLIGDISYSFYLLHDMIGTRVIHLGLRFFRPEWYWVLSVVAMLVSLAVSFVVYRLLERPAKVWAGKLKYSRPAPVAMAAAANG